MNNLIVNLISSSFRSFAFSLREQIISAMVLGTLSMAQFLLGFLLNGGGFGSSWSSANS